MNTSSIRMRVCIPRFNMLPHQESHRNWQVYCYQPIKRLLIVVNFHCFISRLMDQKNSCGGAI
ncbi:unnamed protein product [Moneuplotes crassus]|uniref:Uncharacterized protein n=1 Tax=Euplotes crassus TaxID=5936 RepID=A0AAD1Y8J0_EUPCR|nr:unnamed protein product [Moneuplotes crassus]